MLESHVERLPWGIRKLRQFIQQREGLRLLRSSAFGWLRKILLESGKRHAALGHLDQPEDIFWLELTEWESGKPSEWKPLIAARKIESVHHAEEVYPRSFAAMPGEPAPLYRPELAHADRWEGQRVVSGRLEGRVLVLPSYHPGPYPEFDILVAKHTDPGWSFLIGQSKGLIVEQGGLLSHASIVARELGLPTVIGVPNITQHLQSGDRVLLNATERHIHRL
jgi:pyruvate,water dikinase